MNTCITGLTGQTGAGKTTVSNIFAESGYAVINADEISRYVVRTGTPCLNRIVSSFGSDILLPDGSLDRRALGSLVFGNKEDLDKLCSIIYPCITDETLCRINKFTSEGFSFILLDAPTLFESGMDSMCDTVAAVVSDTGKRLERLKARDRLSEEALKARMASQHSEEFFRVRCEYVIDNNGDEESLFKAAREVADKIKRSFNGGILQ